MLDKIYPTWRYIFEGELEEDATRWPTSEELRPFIGSWVAIKYGKVYHSAATALEVVNKLREDHDIADALFKVPKLDKFGEFGDFYS